MKRPSPARPSSSGCSSRQGAHQDAQTLTNVTLPLNAHDRGRAAPAPSSAASWSQAPARRSGPTAFRRYRGRTSAASGRSQPGRRRLPAAAARAAATARCAGFDAHEAAFSAALRATLDAARLRARRARAAAVPGRRRSRHQPGNADRRQDVGGRDVEGVRDISRPSARRDAPRCAASRRRGGAGSRCASPSDAA